MIYIVVLMYHICKGTAEAEAIVTFPGSSVCNETILLDSSRHAAVIDFRVSTFTIDPNTHFCSFHVESTNTPYVGMKFLSTYLDGHHRKEEQCTFELNITGKEMERTHYNFFPETEISVHTYGYITVKMKLLNCTVESNDTNIFQLLIFRFGEIFCFADEVRCVKSTRCIHEELACSEVYDFCGNDFRNCVNESDGVDTYKRKRRMGPPSVPGIILGSVCLTVLVTFLLYIIACRKRPCLRKMTQKLLCCPSLCHSSHDRRDERINANGTFTNETQDVSFNYSRFREPPPNYFDIQPNHWRQTNNENYLPHTGSAYPHDQNIPPPYYSSEDADETENSRDELPPSYSSVVTSADNLQYI